MTPSASIFLTRWATVTTDTPVFFARSLNDCRASPSSSFSRCLSRLSNFICEHLARLSAFDKRFYYIMLTIVK